MMSAMIGAIVVTSHPGVAKVFLKMIDDMVNGLIGNMSTAKRYMLPFCVAGLLVFFPGTLNYLPFLMTFGEILAFKLGAELMLKNYAKESIMATVDSVPEI